MVEVKRISILVYYCLTMQNGGPPNSPPSGILMANLLMLPISNNGISKYDDLSYKISKSQMSTLTSRYPFHHQIPPPKFNFYKREHTYTVVGNVDWYSHY